MLGCSLTLERSWLIPGLKLMTVMLIGFQIVGSQGEVELRLLGRQPVMALTLSPTGHLTVDNNSNHKNLELIDNSFIDRSRHGTHHLVV